MSVECSICHEKSNIRIADSRLSIYHCHSCYHSFTVIPEVNQEKYEDIYFYERHKNWFENPDLKLFDFIYEKSVSLLGKNKFRFLDVGCGKGDLLKYFVTKNSNVELYGIDLVENEHPGIRFTKGNYLSDKIDTEFDVICNLEVIEHVDKPHEFVQKMYSDLVNDGVLFITTINSNSLLYRTARLLKKVGIRVAFDQLYDHHHLQHYSNGSLRKLLEMNGFSVLLQKNHNYPLKAVDVPKSPFIIEKIFKFTVWTIFLLSAPLQLGQLQTVICKKVQAL